MKNRLEVIWLIVWNNSAGGCQRL